MTEGFVIRGEISTVNEYENNGKKYQVVQMLIRNNGRMALVDVKDYILNRKYEIGQGEIAIGMPRTYVAKDGTARVQYVAKDANGAGKTSGVRV